MSEEHRCPRRDEDFIVRDGVDTWRDNNTCSHCGSGHPDEFMRRVEAGDVALGATDKSYKVYVKALDGSAQFGGPAHKFYFQHLSVDQRKRFVDLFR